MCVELGLRPLLVADGHNVVYTSMWSLPTGAAVDDVVSQSLERIGIATRESRAVVVDVVWDTGKNPKRASLFPAYKENRLHRREADPVPFDLAHAAIRVLKATLSGVGATQSYSSTAAEADDIIANYARSMEKTAYSSMVIFSNDSDLWQLLTCPYELNGQPVVMLSSTGEFMDGDDLLRVKGLYPYQVALYKALCGDSGDNIPGVSGIGKKTALQLVQMYATLGAVKENIDEVEATVRRASCLREAIECGELDLYYKLVELDASVVPDVRIPPATVDYATAQAQMSAVFSKLPRGNELFMLFTDALSRRGK